MKLSFVHIVKRTLATEHQPTYSEFVILFSFLFSVVAFSVDALLPAILLIESELDTIWSLPISGQTLITVFIAGLALGMFVVGPLSDALGRRPVILASMLLYLLATLIGMIAESLEVLLGARFLQGLGASAARSVPVAVVRDLYSGARMAQVMSTITGFFVLIPAIAPLFGSLLMAGFGWRSIFIAFALLGALATLWFMLRQRETLPVEKRYLLTPGMVKAVISDLASRPVVLACTLIIGCNIGQIFIIVVNIAPVLQNVYNEAERFPLWFALVALSTCGASFLNVGFLAIGLPMKYIGMCAAIVGVCVTLVLYVFYFSHTPVDGDRPTPAVPFPLFIFWLCMVFFTAGLSISNFQSIAMESLKHIAGYGATLLTAAPFMLGSLVALLIGFADDTTVHPMLTGIVACYVVALCAIMLVVLRGRRRIE